MTEDETRKRLSENPETEEERLEIEKDFQDMQEAIAREQEQAEAEGLTEDKDEFEKLLESQPSSGKHHYFKMPRRSITIEEIIPNIKPRMKQIWHFTRPTYQYSTALINAQRKARRAGIIPRTAEGLMTKGSLTEVFTRSPNHVQRHKVTTKRVRKN